MIDTHITAPDCELHWRYHVPTNKAAKMLLLTVGRVAVTGAWTGELGESYIAWCPMPRRNKALEAMLFAAKTTT